MMSSLLSPNGGNVNTPVVFPPEVEEALASIINSNDPLDQPDFDVIEYINKVFPTEQSLANVDEFVASIQSQINDLNKELRYTVKGGGSSSTDDKELDVLDEGCQALEEAKQSISQLFAKIKEIKDRADKSESMVFELTRDIRQLDIAKKNLTSSITTLNQVVIFVSSVEELKSLLQQVSSSKPYDKIADCLGKIREVIGGLDKFMDIAELDKLRNESKALESELSGRMKNEMRGMLNAPPRELMSNAAVVGSCCRVVDLLHDSVRSEILSHFVKQQLKEYLVLFEETQECAWLPKIDSRYGWIKKFVIGFNEKYAALFPTEWRVTELLVIEFCDVTAGQLSSLIQKRHRDVEVKLLLFAIERTKLFEEQVSKAFNSEANRPADAPLFSCANKISKCFVPHLTVYIDSVDRNLSELFLRWSKEVKTTSNDSKSSAATSNNDKSSELLPTCADLFVFYKNALKTCSKLSNAEPMMQLSLVFGKYLIEYANKILLASLPTGGRSAQSARDLLKELMSGGSASGMSFFSESTKLTADDLNRVCVVICTAEYCLETTEQLETKLRERIESRLSSKVDFRLQKDNFHSVVTGCIQLLVNDLDSVCEPELSTMVKLPWNSMEDVGDQSQHISAIGHHMLTNIPVIRDGLVSSRKYFTQFCNKFVSTFTLKFKSSVFRCRPMNTNGARQMQLDIGCLKALLLNLPNVGSPLTRKAPAAFTELVTKEMTKLENIVKMVLSDHSNYQSFVDDFCRLLRDSDLTDFQKVLEMKGVRRSEQMALIDVYSAAKPHDSVLTPSNAPPVASRSLLSVLTEGTEDLSGRSRGKTKR